jgi:hypothetical protein
METAHFRVFAGSTSVADVRAAADRLEVEYARATAAFELAALPMISVRIWQDQSTYFNELTRYFGMRLPASGYLAGPIELRVLAGPSLNTTVAHEFMHAVSLAVNPSFANNPRWLWETVALYENSERVDPRSLTYLVSGAFPTLQQLNADVTASQQIYQVGYLLGEFIVSTWGRPAYLQLIRSNGNLPAVLGVSASEFEARWQSYVRSTYF